MEAPIPLMEANLKKAKKLFTKEFEIKPYKFFLSTTDNNTVLLEAKIIADFVTCYYELEYEYRNFSQLSEIFSKCNDIEEIYKLLIHIFDKNEVKISIKKDSMELSFSLDASTNQKEEVKIYLDKKQVDINISLNKLKFKIDEIQNNQEKLEIKIENIIKDMNLIKDKQNNIEKEINSIKSIQSKIESKNNDTSQDLNKSFKNIEIINGKIFENFEKIKKERITYSEIEQKVEELNKQNDENKNIINNQKNILDELNNKISNCKNSLEEKSKDINEIKENQKEMKKVIDEKIESATNLIKSIKDQNALLTKKMNENENKIKKLQMKLEKKVYKKEKGKRPINYKLEKTISSDLFEKLNCDNKCACIFNCNEDDKIYVVYGVNSFDLECYDIQNDNKFIIINKLHKDIFYSCRHFFNEEKNQDLIITSSLDKHVKVTNFHREKSEIIIDLNFEENQKLINTAYFSHESILVPFSDDSEGSLQIYSMDSYYIGEFEEKSGFILGLTTYFCEKRNQNFILVSNRKGILSYIIDNFYLFQKYIPADSSKEIKDNIIMDENGFSEAYVIENDDNLILVGPSFNQGLYFWDFINGNLISKMEIKGIINICLWNNDFLIASVNKSDLCEFILIDANQQKIDKKIGGGMMDKIGSGIQLLRNLSKGNFLISFSNKGELKLYTLESK